MMSRVHAAFNLHFTRQLDNFQAPGCLHFWRTECRVFKCQATTGADILTIVSEFPERQ